MNVSSQSCNGALDAASACAMRHIEKAMFSGTRNGGGGGRAFVLGATPLRTVSRHNRSYAVQRTYLIVGVAAAGSAVSVDVSILGVRIPLSRVRAKCLW